MRQKYQSVPKFDQSCEMVVQLEPEVQDDCIYYPAQVVKIPAEQLEEKTELVNDGKIIIDDKVTIARLLPVSKIGLCKRVDIIDAGFELREVEPAIIKDPIEIVKELPTLDTK